MVSGGVRRTSEIGLIDADDETCIQAKSHLYRQVGGRWEIDKSIAHRQMSNNSIYYRKKPTREKAPLASPADAVFRGARVDQRGGRS